jgi:hypothetical protein
MYQSLEEFGDKASEYLTQRGDAANAAWIKPTCE